jgi:hypothetical protein
MKFSRFLGVFVSLCFCVVLAGCGDGLQYSTVSGTVTRHGKPAPCLDVQFTPLNPPKGHGVAGIGFTNGEGVFKVFYPAARPTIPVGEYNVSFARTDGATILIDIPEKYREGKSELVVNVKGRSCSFDFNLDE